MLTRTTEIEKEKEKKESKVLETHKHKTAYEIVPCEGSSDVCSSDILPLSKRLFFFFFLV